MAVCGTRYGHGLCTVLWIKVADRGWILLPHGIPNLSVHLGSEEFAAMLDGLRESCNQNATTCKKKL